MFIIELIAAFFAWIVKEALWWITPDVPVAIFEKLNKALKLPMPVFILVIIACFLLFYFIIVFFFKSVNG